MAIKKVKKQNSRLAIITGASQGIGRTPAFGLVEDGYNLALVVCKLLTSKKEKTI